MLNKNAFDTASLEWEAAQAVLHEEMEPFVRRLLKRREPGEPSDEERLRAMEAHDIAQRALEQIAADSAAQGRGGRLAGRKPPVDPKRLHARQPKKAQTSSQSVNRGRLRRLTQSESSPAVALVSIGTFAPWIRASEATG